eukprot:CAMPEP_0172927818 /NCGR_PEP_ID=MMETSP1075-20121228/217658_1 /TAXON_ID=2916 /ORGANISM="Ceratium fusus, Strain PA161109" /LENGTH=842 /DNA_ID=CAMNT_0013789093 /DNA_START=46 /DNA_END=2574 /DNA_ORIENTATION=+
MTAWQQHVLLATTALLLVCTPGHATRLNDAHPVAKVLPLIIKLKATIEEDGKKEQKSFDKHQCWCEKTLERKAKNIADAKETAGSLQKLINKLEGELGSHKAEIDQLKKDIAANLASQKEANGIRDKEYEEYNTEKTENEQCVGALESAITVLTGAGSGKKKEGLLALPEAKILSVAADVRWIMQKPVAWKSTSAADMAMIRNFVEHPGALKRTGRKDGTSALQLRNNPFGDYAPQSTQIQGILKGMYDAFTADLEKDNVEEAEKQQASQIQGILKGMYDAFTADLEKDNVEEAEKQKAYEEFMKTKKAEQKTLELTLEKQEDAKAKKTKLLSDSKTDRDDTKDQLAADEVFFEDTKTSCQNVASVWAERSRLRTEELQGIITAIKILRGADATFTKATATLLQVQQVHTHQVSKPAQGQAFHRLRNLAAKYKSLGLAQIAAQMQMGGHFDKVIIMIDTMIEHIRKEEAEDIAHRDRCQNAEGKMRGADATFTKATATLLQVQQVHTHQVSKPAQGQAFHRLRNLAAKYKSLGLAQIAAQMQMGGHFDKVIIMIDTMIEHIRKEEAEDIAHRDRCQNAEGKNANDMEDIRAAQEKTKEKIGRLKDKVKDIKSTIDDLEKEMKDTKNKMEERLKLRNGEREDFESALKVDQEAIDSLNQAIVALMKFYKKNKIPLNLAQEDPKPKYTLDPDKAPELEWAGQDSYGGRKEESTGIIAILSMIVEDFQNEMKTGRQDDAEAQEDYEKDRAAMEEVLHALKESHANKMSELAETQEAMSDAEGFLEQKNGELGDEADMKKTLTGDCDWIRTHFKSRRSKRKAELDGLAEAKNILAGGGDSSLLAFD